MTLGITLILLELVLSIFLSNLWYRCTASKLDTELIFGNICYGSISFRSQQSRGLFDLSATSTESIIPTLTASSSDGLNLYLSLCLTSTRTSCFRHVKAKYGDHLFINKYTIIHGINKAYVIQIWQWKWDKGKRKCNMSGIYMYFECVIQECERFKHISCFISVVCVSTINKNMGGVKIIHIIF